MWMWPSSAEWPIIIILKFHRHCLPLDAWPVRPDVGSEPAQIFRHVGDGKDSTHRLPHPETFPRLLLQVCLGTKAFSPSPQSYINAHIFFYCNVTDMDGCVHIALMKCHIPITCRCLFNSNIVQIVSFPKSVQLKKNILNIVAPKSTKSCKALSITARGSDTLHM